MTSRRKLRAQVADLSRQLDHGRQINARLLAERDAAQEAARKAQTIDRQSIVDLRAADAERGRLARQVVDLTAEVEAERERTKFAERAAARFAQERDTAQADTHAVQCRLDATRRHVELLIRVGGYMAPKVAPVVRAEWNDAVRGVSRRDAHGNFTKAAAS